MRGSGGDDPFPETVGILRGLGSNPWAPDKTGGGYRDKVFVPSYSVVSHRRVPEWLGSRLRSGRQRSWGPPDKGKSTTLKFPGLSKLRRTRRHTRVTPERQGDGSKLETPDVRSHPPSWTCRSGVGGCRKGTLGNFSDAVLGTLL